MAILLDVLIKIVKGNFLGPCVTHGITKYPQLVTALMNMEDLVSKPPGLPARLYRLPKFPVARHSAMC